MAKKKGPRDWYPTELLRKRCAEWKIPMPTGWPIDNQVLVWRLPPISLSIGGLILPDDGKSPNIKGILMAMGPRAMDFLKSNGIEEGHTVVFKRFAGWEPHDQTATQKLKTEFVILKDRDIEMSDDLMEQLSTGRAKYVLVDGRHCLQRKLLNGKKEKLLALAASTDSKAEADTARKLAAEVQ